MRQKLKEGKKQVMEAWLSGFVAQGVGGVLKVLLVCKNDLRVDRVVNRDGNSVKDTVALMKKRESENLKKWRRVYGREWKEWVVNRGILPSSAPIDFWHPKLYDVVIDTYSSSRKETLKIVLDELVGEKVDDKTR
ncbi:cytidylate kinase family protein [Pseudomonadota bacterium]